MDTILSWFNLGPKKSTHTATPPVSTTRTGKKSKLDPQTYYDLVDKNYSVVMGNLPEPQAINYCLLYRLKGLDVFLVKREGMDP